MWFELRTLWGTSDGLGQSISCPLSFYNKKGVMCILAESPCVLAFEAAGPGCLLWLAFASSSEVLTNGSV